MQESLTAVIDYGVGNLFSITSSLKYVGAQTEVTGDAEAIRRADRIVLPGVGAFGDAAAKLRARGLDEAVKDAAADGIPLLGICLGMQLLFNRSFEFGEHEGLGLVSGTVEPLSDMLPDMYKIPQIGWNALQITNPACPILRDTNDGEFVYFVHSYHAVNCTDSLAATTEYGRDVTALVWKDNVFGCQFHPEKSGEVGLRMLRAFCGL